MNRAIELLVAGILVALSGVAQSLYVSSYNNNAVIYYDGITGGQKGVFGAGTGSTQGITIGPDNNGYVASHNTNQILKYSLTGTLLGIFASVDKPTGITFGPDGNLYVVSYDIRSVIRYNGSTGALIGTFVANSGLEIAYGLTFDAVGNLYVGSSFEH